MDNVKTITLKKGIALEAAKFAILLSIAICAPLIKYQPITGTIVNAVLFLSVIYLGARRAILIALIPSVFSLATGLLPAVLAPMVPFIMISNVTLILIFDFFCRKNFGFGAILAAVIKFVILAVSSNIILGLLMKKEIAWQVAAMMSWPQLLTAMGGALLAFLVIRVIKNPKN
jgi:hypothetical protein